MITAPYDSAVVLEPPAPGRQLKSSHLEARYANVSERQIARAQQGVAQQNHSGTGANTNATRYDHVSEGQIAWAQQAAAPLTHSGHIIADAKYTMPPTDGHAQYDYASSPAAKPLAQAQQAVEQQNRSTANTDGAEDEYTIPLADGHARYEPAGLLAAAGSHKRHPGGRQQSRPAAATEPVVGPRPYDSPQWPPRPPALERQLKPNHLEARYDVAAAAGSHDVDIGPMICQIPLDGASDHASSRRKGNKSKAKAKRASNGNTRRLTLSVPSTGGMMVNPLAASPARRVTNESSI